MSTSVLHSLPADRLRAEDPFTAGSLAKLTWFLRMRIRDAHAKGHPHAQQLQDSVEDAVRGILDYVDQAAHTADPHALAPARVRAHALWNALQAAAAFWDDNTDDPSTAVDPARYTTAY
ncbi:hypothetical protein [Streptacidiphilus neutrinimicus]|uniref:hypothetical protein n=1 Tax=Streptacidiphilus neutrinimicus TaxID=105420 RepID=UPI0005A79B6D|nr:hypothetical protein [Streptacidiphilus neutrinimicus]